MRLFEASIELEDSLWEVYRTELESLGLLSECIAGSTKRNIYGGISKEDTYEHFSQRFPNSCSRISYLLKDPKKDFELIVDDVLSYCSSHTITILDFACGAGACVLGMLAHIHKLRVDKEYPTLPLDIILLAADISEYALDIYRSILSEFSDRLLQVGVSICFHAIQWDAAQPNSTSILCDLWFEKSKDATDFLVLANTLSGVGLEKINEFKRSIEHISERLGNKSALVLWVEHEGNSGIKTLKKVKDFFRSIPWFRSRISGDEVKKYSFNWHHKLQDKLVASGMGAVCFKRKDFESGI